MGRYVKELKSGKLKINTATIRQEEKRDGKYLLSTNDPRLPTEDIARSHKHVLDVARAFHALKNS